MGTRARAQGLLLDPAPWTILVATLLWLTKLAHQRTCQQDRIDAPVKAMLRMCYSDVPVVWNANQWGRGGPSFTDQGLPQTPVVSALVAVQRFVLGVFTPLSGGSSPQQALDSGNQFLVMNSVVLFGFFLAMVMAHMLMGRTSTLGVARDQSGVLVGGPVRSWDGMYIATSIGVFTAALINWDLVAPAFMALALMAWSSGRPVVAGVLTGLGLGAGIAPVVLVIALVVLCLRAGVREALANYLLATVATTAVVVMVGLMLAATGTRKAYLTLLDPAVGYGSIWWLLTDIGLSGELVPTFSKVAIAAAMIGVVLFTLSLARRARVAQVMALLMIAGLALAPTYSPQYVLWLVGVVALARPALRDWIIFSLTEALYWAAIWGHLQGNLRLNWGDDVAYPLAIMVRLLGQGWMFWRIAHDMRHPETDPVRQAGVDDPQGGVLDGSADSAWMSEPPAPRDAAGADHLRANDLEPAEANRTPAS